MVLKLSDRQKSGSEDCLLHPQHNHPQQLRVPQGCILSPPLFSINTHDCTATHSSNSLGKFADDKVVVGLINNDETACLDEVEVLSSWCNVTKKKELVVDSMRKEQADYTPIKLYGAPVTRL